MGTRTKIKFAEGCTDTKSKAPVIEPHMAKLPDGQEVVLLPAGLVYAAETISSMTPAYVSIISATSGIALEATFTPAEAVEFGQSLIDAAARLEQRINR